MYFFIRRNFNFLTKLLFIFSIISMLYGSFEYSKAKKKKKEKEKDSKGSINTNIIDITVEDIDMEK
mgnify:CR=1 FL=1